MSGAATPPNQPGTAPSRSRRLLALVRRLIDYGKELAATLHERAATDLLAVRASFGTADLALILARIKRGLLRANALEARLVQNAARLDAERKPRAVPVQHDPHPGREHGSAVRRIQEPDAPFELPTEAEIAAWVRRRPIGAVIADICRDLGIRFDHPLWRDLHDAIMCEGGSCVRLVLEIIHRGAKLVAELWFRGTPPASASTGPP